MTDYIAANIHYSPRTQDSDDLLAAFLAEEGYESFVDSGDCLTAYIVSEAYAPGAVEDILASFPMQLESFAVETEKIVGKDWNEEWEKNYFQPIVVGDRCVVHSTFHTDVPKAEIDIVVDPKMAFGTGHHATTSMMMSFILEQELEGKTVVDMGSGTGILAILAMKHGAGQAYGIEIDPAACENAVENVRLNDVEVKMLAGDSARLADVPKADLFLANINRNVILADLKRYADALKSGGTMLLSGFYVADIPLLERAATLYGLEIQERKQREASNFNPESPEYWTSLRLLKKF